MTTAKDRDIAWIESILAQYEKAPLVLVGWELLTERYNLIVGLGWPISLRMDDVANRDALSFKAQLSVMGFKLKESARIADAIADQLVITVTNDMPRLCDWCKNPECKTEGTYCSGYLSCLAERIAAGANDCPEERASVERWCDARRLEWEANGNPLRDPPPKCAECCWAPAPSTLGFMRGANGQALCVYCFHETVGGQFSRAQVDRGVSWQMRPRPASASAPAPESKNQPWQAWATPTYES